MILSRRLPARTSPRNPIPHDADDGNIRRLPLQHNLWTMEGDEFLRRMAAGDISVWDDLMPKAEKTARRVCSLLRIPERDRDDIVQELVLRVFSRWKTYEGGKFTAWIRKIAVNLCIDYLARKKVEGAVIVPDGPLSPDDPEGPWLVESRPDETIPPPLRTLCVYAMLRELEEQDSGRENGRPMAEVLRWCVENDPTSDELAAYLNVDPDKSTARERKRYIRKRVRELCRKHCGNDECRMEG